MRKVDVGAMMEGMRGQLARDEADGKLVGITVDDLAAAMAHPKAPEAIAEVSRWEAGSVKPGEPAPDFTLPWLNRPESAQASSVTLSDHFGDRPVALVFGSYT